MSIPAPRTADMYCCHLPGPPLIMAFPPISEMAPTSHCWKDHCLFKATICWTSYLCWLCTLTVASCVSSPTMKWVRCASCQLHLDILGPQSFRMMGRATPPGVGHPSYWTVGHLVKWAHRCRCLLNMGGVKDVVRQWATHSLWSH